MMYAAAKFVGETRTKPSRFKITYFYKNGVIVAKRIISKSFNYDTMVSQIQEQEGLEFVFKLNNILYFSVPKDHPTAIEPGHTKE